MKFGGTSVADLELIGNAARRVKAEVESGHEVAVVVSAMSGVTNQLVEYVDQAAKLFDLREYDVVVSSGEQVTSGLLAVILQDMGVPARSWLGWQIPLLTDEAHGNARIENVDTSDIVRRFADGQVAVVAGFQGIDPHGRVTTLGRGGTDTSAVALAAALGAERCDIYTDVDGVYTSDPRIVTQARKLDKITYEEMLELASLGAKVPRGGHSHLNWRDDQPCRRRGPRLGQVLCRRRRRAAHRRPQATGHHRQQATWPQRRHLHRRRDR